MIPATARAPLAVGAAALLGTVLVGVVDPNDPGHYPLCPTKAMFGVDCPFCGGLRAVHSLAHGDVVGAADHNLFVVVLALPVVVLWLAWLRREWVRGSDPAGATDPSDAWRPLQTAAWALTRPQVLWSAVAVMVVFSVVRNLTAVPALAWLGSGTVS